MSISNLVLDNFTLEELQKIRLGESRNNRDRTVLLNTTLREFKRGTILRYDYVIYNPKRGKRKKMRSLRNLSKLKLSSNQ